MDPLFLSIVVFAAGWLAHWLLVRKRLQESSGAQSETRPPTASGKHSETPTSSAGDLVQRLYKLVDPVETFLEDSAHPQDLLTFPDFMKGASLFADEDLKLDEVADYATGANFTIACMALEGLSNRPDSGSVSTRIAEFTGNYAGWSIFFVLRYARSFATPPFFGHFLTKANDWWVRNPIVMDRIRDTVDSLSGPALEAELTAFTTHLGSADSSDNVRAVLDLAGDGQAARFRDALNEWEGSHTDVAKLATLGSIWDSNDVTGLVEHAAARTNLEHIESELVANHRSVMLVGERGVGKTAVIRLLAAQLQKQGWIVFETPGSRLMAGNVYMGQLEKHLLDIIAAV
ncbi:MAG: AAA family ATPase, partial [Rhodothermales bacterium]|nr:AAA family ATPase [Rhodothermales bacterium]